MEGIIFGKLKTISKSFLRPGDLFFQAKTPIQILQDSSILDQSDKKNQTFQNLSLSEKTGDVSKEETPTANKDHAVKLKKDDEEEAQERDNDKDLLLQESKELVVLYTTSLRGIRKTYEDCNAIRFLLQSFRVVFHERDVSMHLEYREELRRRLGGNNNGAVPPRLFIRGKYIGGAEEVVGLHENGMLSNLLGGLQLSPNPLPCKGCGGVHFLLCVRCSGSRKLANGGDSGSVKCPDCNENGLVKCSVCS